MLTFFELSLVCLCNLLWCSGLFTCCSLFKVSKKWEYVCEAVCEMSVMMSVIMSDDNFCDHV